MSDKSGRDAEKNDDLRQLINQITEMFGRGVGAIVSVSLGPPGDPGGAAIGAIAGKTIENFIIKGGKEFSARLLSQREEERVVDAIAIATAEIYRRLQNGESHRKDGFFDEKQTGRSDAAEVAESVLLKTQREPEEKKIPYMGYLLASIAFEPKINVQMAHQLSKTAEQLTYRQLCILKLCAVKDNFGLRDNNYRECTYLKKDLYEVLYECADLHNKEYIHSGLDTITFESNVLSRLRSIVPSNMAFHTIGDYLYNLMKLSQIPDKDIVPVAEQLQ